MSQAKSSRMQSLPVKRQVASWLPSSDVRQLSTVSKSFSEATKEQLRSRRQQQYRRINSTLGEQLSKLGIQHAHLAPEITHTPMLPIAMFTSVSDARRKLLPAWDFKKDRLVYSKSHGRLYWLLSGKNYYLHHNFLIKIAEKLRQMQMQQRARR